MKAKLFSAVLFLLMMSAAVASAKTKIVKFKALGDCGQCESRIEKAANSIKGVKLADWNKQSQLLTVKVDESVSEETIQKAVAAVGHDTPKFKAPDKVYNALPKCCKYPR